MHTITRPGEELLYMIKEWMKAEQIKFECAPFEADWQLVCLECHGVIDGIMAMDSECQTAETK